MPRSPLAVVPDLEAELDALYGLPLEEFTQTRNDLAKRLARAGQDEVADRVRKLAKPSVVAWAANQLSRLQPERVRELLELGARLREAQERALRGEADARHVREAAAEERRAVRDLTAKAQGVLGSRRAALADRLAALLRAAAVDQEGRRALERGRLSGELEPQGFEAFAHVPAKPRARPRPKPRDDAAHRRRLEEAGARVRALEAEEQAHRNTEASGMRKVERARVALERAEAAVEQAESEAASARSAADETATELARAREELEALAP